MTPDELVQFIEKGARSIYAEGDRTKEHAPMLFIEAKAGEGLAIMLLAEFGDDFTKEVLRKTCELLAATGVHCLGMVMEGWMTMARSEAHIDEIYKRHKRLADLPPDDRMEMLVIHAASATGVAAKHWKIRRNGATVTLEPFDIASADKVRSRWLSDLPWRPSSAPHFKQPPTPASEG